MVHRDKHVHLDLLPDSSDPGAYRVTIGRDSDAYFAAIGAFISSHLVLNLGFDAFVGTDELSCVLDFDPFVGSGLNHLSFRVLRHVEDDLR